MGGSSSKGYSKVGKDDPGESIKLNVAAEGGDVAYGTVTSATEVNPAMPGGLMTGIYPTLDGSGEEKSTLYNTEKETGLTVAEAARRYAKFGPNSLDEKEVNHCLKLAIEFVQPMPLVVWVAMIVEAIEYGIDGGSSPLVDIIVLFLLQMLNVFVGYIEEMKSGDAVAALRGSLKKDVAVFRGGEQKVVTPADLVPGDVVEFSHGCGIPADCQLMKGGHPIKVDQAQLTGESLPVEISAGKFALMGSTLKQGHGRAIVVATGSQTFLGKTAAMVQVEGMGHFEIVLQQLLIALVAAGVTVMTIVFIYLMVVIEERFMTVLSFNVVLLIASIPIALKVVCTTTLALGSQQLAKERAIVTRLSSIEELAGLTLLCSDKTGTLTTGKMILKDDLDQNSAEFIAMADGHPGREGFHRVWEKGKNNGKDWTRQDLLQFACMATQWDNARHATEEEREGKLDAIDFMLLNSEQVDAKGNHIGGLDWKALDDYEHEKEGFQPFDPAIKRTSAHVVNKRTKAHFKIAKGATNTLLKMCDNYESFQKDFDASIESFASRGIRAIALIRTDDVKEDEQGESKGWYMLGFLCFLDPPRPDTAHVIAMAESFGVEVKMITGDAQAIAVEMCKTIGLPKKHIMEKINKEKGVDFSPHILKGLDVLPQLPVENLMKGKCDDGTRDPNKKKEDDQKYWDNCTPIGDKYGELCLDSNGFAGVLPEHKFLIVEALRQSGHMVGMCGDGVNDAPALARADVGIAVSGATEAAQASADIVLTDPGLSTIVTAMVVSRKIFTRMKNFVIYRVACTEQLLFFFLISCLAFNPREYAPKGEGYHPDDWPEYFSLPVIALVTICILNDGTIISVAYDNVEASLKPEAWDLKVMYWVASVIGLVALASSILLLDLGLKSAQGGDNGLCAFGVKAQTFPEIQTMMYLKISLSDYCSVFNSRTKGWCWSRAPSLVVVGAACLAVTAATFFSAYWPFGSGMKGLDWDVIAIVWVYVLLWSLVQDAAKVLNNSIMCHLGVVENLGVVDEDKLSFQMKQGTGPEDCGTAGAANYGSALTITRRRTVSCRDSIGEQGDAPLHGLFGEKKHNQPSQFSGDPTIQTPQDKSAWGDQVDRDNARQTRDRSLSGHDEHITHQLMSQPTESVTKKVDF